MRCDEFEERVHESLDQRIAPSSQEPLKRHARACASCGELLAACERLYDGLHFFELPGPSRGFSERVVAHCSDLRRRRRWWTARVAAVAMVAALVLIVLVPRFLWRSTPDAVLSPHSGRASESLVSSTASTASEAALHPKPAPGDGQKGVDIEQVQLFWDQWATRLRDERWKRVDRITGELTPITEPLSVAIDEIRSAIPLGRANQAAGSAPDSVKAERVLSVWGTV